MNSKRSSSFSSRRFAALICIAVYLAGGVEVVPDLIAVAAWLEGSHRVCLARTQDHVTVVLSHDRAGSSAPAARRPSLQHSHGTASRFICLFADQSQTGSDHVAQFTGNQTAERTARALTTATASVTFAALPARAAGDPLADYSFRQRSSAVAGERHSDSLICLRSTVLVI